MQTYEIWYWSSATRTKPAIDTRYKEFLAVSGAHAVEQLRLHIREHTGEHDREFSFRVYEGVHALGNFMT